jgi:hypothetical protein
LAQVVEIEIEAVLRLHFVVDLAAESGQRVAVLISSERDLGDRKVLIEELVDVLLLVGRQIVHLHGLVVVQHEREVAVRVAVALRLAQIVVDHVVELFVRVRGVHEWEKVEILEADEDGPTAAARRFVQNRQVDAAHAVRLQIAHRLQRDHYDRALEQVGEREHVDVFQVEKWIFVAALARCCVPVHCLNFIPVLYSEKKQKNGERSVKVLFLFCKIIFLSILGFFFVGRKRRKARINKLLHFESGEIGFSGFLEKFFYAIWRRKMFIGIFSERI